MSGCKACGDCCAWVAFELNPMSHDWAQLHGLKTVIEQGTLMVRFDVPCSLWDHETKKCTDYANRPLTCQLYLCDEAKA